MRIRQGNDFIFLWTIERNEVPEDFSNAENIRLHFKNFDSVGEVESFQIVDGNIVRVEVSPEWASNLGAYRLILSYEFEDLSYSDGDRKCVVDVLAFNIVPKTSEADDITEMAKTTDIMIGLKGDKGIGVPIGGTTGQQLVKKSNVDYDFEWQTPAGAGDMLKSVYDSDGDGVVDNAEKVNGFTVETNVPANAEFTDTIYTHPETHPASMIAQTATARFVTDEQIDSWDEKETPEAAQTKATTALNLAKEYVDGKVKTDVPTGAKFTDTIYTHPTTAGNKHIPAGGASGQILRYSASGTAVWDNENNTTYTAGQGLILTGTVFTPDFGTGAGKVVQGNDARLSDARTPLAHNQAISTITGLQSALDDKVDNSRVLTDVPANAKFTDTTYSEITEAEINTGTASTLRTITARRVTFILSKVSTLISNAISALTKNDVGLGNLDNIQQATKEEFNTHDADDTRHITAGERSAWNAKWDYNESTIKNVKVNNAANADTVNGKTVAENVPAGAKFTDTIYSHPTSDGNLHVPATGTTNNGKVLKAGATAGSLVWGTDNDTITTINGKTGAITKADIVALGIPAQDTVYVHPGGTNPHGTTKADVGLGNVDNTSDTNKPVSTAQQAALDSKQDTLIQGSNITITGNTISAVDTTYGVATTSANGLMSSADKSKLDGIAAGANNYSLPTASATVLGGIKVGSRLTISSGVLSANVQSDNNFTNAYKTKLDGIEAGANNYVHPDSHPASMITQSSSYRFVTDAEKSTWNAKSDLALGTTSSTAYRGDRGKIAYDHSQEAHAPANAQKNSDITKAEIEAKLTGDITSHTHSAYVPTSRTVAGKALTGNITLAKADVGLGNVDNTSDANKPVSTAQAAAIALKIDASKFQVVAELPASPTAGVFYFVKE
jgi:hypothetical protein